MSGSAFVLGDGENATRARDWVRAGGSRFARTRVTADVIVVSEPDPMPTRRRSEQVVVALVDTYSSAWRDSLRRGAVDAVVAVAPDIAAQWSSVVFDATGLDGCSLDELRSRAMHKPRIAIGTSVRFVARAELWGDTHFARDLSDALRRVGWRTEIQTHTELRRSRNAANDILLYLRGLRPSPQVRTLSAQWIISHPSSVARDELSASGARFAAGARAADTFGAELLLQATDPHRFHYEPTQPDLADRVLFVGNGKGRNRASVDLAIAGNLPLALVGPGWAKLHPELLFAAGVDNDSLHRWYSSAAIVLNDHWVDMAQYGMFSNRLFDALACGATVVSDHVDGLADATGGFAESYLDRSEFLDIVSTRLREPCSDDLRTRRRAFVLEHHSFDHRARVLDQALRKLLTRASVR